MPKLWNDTIDKHRRDVREAIMDTTRALVTEHGLLAVTMSQIAGETGIGRATLYKYFPDVETILYAWHERQVSAHLAHLKDLRDGNGTAQERLAAVLQVYARICHYRERHSTAEIGALLHRGERVAEPERRLRKLFRDLLAEGAVAGDVRVDVPPDELASYCMHALSAASRLPTAAAVRRLVAVTLDALRPPR